MRAGTLRHSITIENPVRTTTAKGGRVTTWATFAVVHASIVPIRGDERFLSTERFAEVDYTIRIRYLEGLDPTFRINWNLRERIFEIIAIMDKSEKKRELEILAREEPVDRG